MQIELREIEKSFGQKRVLKKISFCAQSGSAFGLLGRNGAGKTTTMRILMDVFRADAGEILVDGRPIDYGNIKIGYLPEERGLYPKKKIFEQLVYFARLKGMGKKQAGEAVLHWLDRLEMTEYKDKKLQTLSKGNQQKIQLITALAHQPDLIVLDEPFSGLDPVNAGLLKDVVREQIAEGRMVVFSSHQMNYIEEFCDSIAILNNGSVAISGGLREIQRSYPRKRLYIRTNETERMMAQLGTAAEQVELDLLHLTLQDEAERKTMMQQLTCTFDIEAIGVIEPTLSDIFVEHTADEGQAEPRGEEK